MMGNINIMLLTIRLLKNSILLSLLFFSSNVLGQNLNQFCMGQIIYINKDQCKCTLFFNPITQSKDSIVSFNDDMDVVKNIITISLSQDSLFFSTDNTIFLKIALKEGQMEGKAHLNIGRREQTGYFTINIRNGDFEIIDGNTKSFFHYNYGKLEGVFLRTIFDQPVYSAFYVNGLKEGGEFYFGMNQSFEGGYNYKEGVIVNDTYYFYFSDGRISSIKQFKNGVLNGYSITFNNIGIWELKSVSKYKNGKFIKILSEKPAVKVLERLLPAVVLSCP